MIRRLLRRAFFVALTVVVFVSALAVGAIIHLRLPVVRAALVQEVDSALASTFAGTIHIDGIESVGFGGLRGGHGIVTDPDGVTVIAADHIDATVSVLSVARALIVGDEIVIDDIHVVTADVLLDQKGDELRLARAFAPRQPSTSPSSGAPMRLFIRHASLDHAWAHGIISGQVIDADVRDATANVRLVGDAVEVDVDQAGIEARAMPRNANPIGRVTARVRSAKTTRVTVQFRGVVGTVPALAVGMLDDQRFDVHVVVPETEAEHIRALVPEAPIHAPVFASAEAAGTFKDFSFHADAGLGKGRVALHGRFDDGKLAGRANVRHFDVSTVDPKLGFSDIAGDAVVDLRDGAAVALAHVDAPGGHVTIDASMNALEYEAEATGTLTNVNTVLAPFVNVPPIGGHGAFHFKGNIDRKHVTVRATAWARIEGASVATIGSGVLNVDAHAEGPLDNPTVGVDIYVERLTIPHLALTSARVRVEGQARDARVLARVTANGPFDVSARVRIDHDGAVAVDDVLVMSDDKKILDGAFDWRNGTAAVRLTARNVDLAQVKRTLGVDFPLDGHVNLDVDAHATAASVEGHATVDVVHGEWADVHGIDAHVELASLGGAWSIVSRARAEGIGWVSVESVDLRPTGSPYAIASWRRAIGSVHLAGSGDIGAIAKLIGKPDTAAGFGSAAIVIVRRTPDARPEVQIDASTNHLTIAGKAYDLDLGANVHIDPTGAVGVHATLGGTTLEARTHVSWDDLLAGKLPNVQTLPFTADFGSSKHDAAPLCHNFGFGCRGEVAMTGHFDGSAGAPRGKVSIGITNFRSGVSPIAEPIDAKIDATYDRGTGDAVAVAVLSRSKARVLDAKVKGTFLPLSDWTASGDATFHDLPLRAPPAYSDEQVAAKLNGTAKLTDLHHDARVVLKLDATDVSIDGVRSDHIVIAGGFDGSDLSLSTQLTATGSNLDARVRGAATWGAAMMPAIDPRSPLALSLRATHFRVRNLMPLVPLEVGEIDGTVDADVSATVALAPARYDVKGWAKIAGGVVKSSSVGELQDIQAKVEAKPDGSFALEDAHVRGTSGLVKLTGSAHAVHGLFSEARFDALIARADKFPLVVGGARMGDAWGHIEAIVRPKGDGFGIALDVPSLHVVVPDQSGHSLQDLTPAHSISIGIRDRKGELVPVALGPPRRVKSRSTPISIAVTLGNDVEITRGDMLRVDVVGKPTIELGDDTRVTGQLHLTRGTIEVQGKRFVIEQGIVTFVGSPTNPILVVAAGWDAPDGTHVIARYVGPLDGGKLTLSSEPARTEDEIVALLVFGRADGATPSSGGNTTDAVTSQAVSSGASFATQPLNKALDQLTHIDIRTRVDTSGSVAKSELEVQIAKQVSAQVAYVLGLPPPGTEPDRTYLTLSWHVSAHWSLDFTVGDHGTSIVDALWKKRY